MVLSHTGTYSPLDIPLFVEDLWNWLPSQIRESNLIENSSDRSSVHGLCRITTDQLWSRFSMYSLPYHPVTS